MPLLSKFRNGPQQRYQELSIQKRLGGVEVNIQSVEILRSLLLGKSPLRYKPLVSLLRSALGHRVMIIADGEAWRQTHEVIQAEFQARLVESDYAPVITKVAADAFADLVSQHKDSNIPLEIEFESLMRAITSSVMGYVMFGEALSIADASYIERTLSAVTQVVDDGLPARINLGIGIFLTSLKSADHQPVVFPRVQRQAMKDMMSWISTRIDQAKASGRQPALLESLNQRYSQETSGKQRRMVCAEFAMLFIAGIETTSAALTFAVAEIAKDPGIAEKVVQEARQNPSTVSCHHALAAQYPYLHNLFRETLRRHTIVPTLLRESESDYEVVVRPQDGDVEGDRSDKSATVPKGATLRYLPLQSHMRGDVWPCPRDFDPDRFANPLTAEQSRHYMPFGFGPQRCPGHAMARAELILILSAFFRQFDLVATSKRSRIPIKRNAVFTNRPVGVVIHAKPVGSRM